METQTIFITKQVYDFSTLETMLVAYDFSYCQAIWFDEYNNLICDFPSSPVLKITDLLEQKRALACFEATKHCSLETFHAIVDENIDIVRKYKEKNNEKMV